MTSSLFPLFFAQAEGGGAGMTMLLIWVLFIGGMYFLLIAPQRKRQKQHAKMITELKPGDQVMTQGGIIGKITSVKEDRVSIKVDDATTLEISKPFISSKMDGTAAS